MKDELRALLADAAGSGWAEEPSRRLAGEIETRIVIPLPGHLRSALGNDEATQLARVVAWERCRLLAGRPSTRTVTWGYLANVVRWRLADAVRSAVRRHRLHPLIEYLPDLAQAESVIELGPRLEQVVVELERAGLSTAAARRLVGLAAEGPGYTRSAIVGRLRGGGVGPEQADALAWLLRGGSVCPSAVARLASGEPSGEVFADETVRRWITEAAGDSRGVLDIRAEPGRARLAGTRARAFDFRLARSA